MSSTPSHLGGRFFYFGVQPAGDFCVWGGGERKAFPYEGKVARREPWRMRWRQLRFRDAVHLISRLAATASPHRGSHWRAHLKASPSRGGGSAEPRRRGCCKFATTSQSAFGCQLLYRVTASAALRRIRRRSCSPAARGWRAPWPGRARARGAWAGDRGRRPGGGIPRRSHTAPFCRPAGRAG